jgi:post-segregation antitoxin (ccd killing protein)
MTITLALDPEVERHLLERAQERGLTLSAYLEDLVKAEAERPRANSRAKSTEFLAWAKGHRPTKLLSDEAVSRASMYSDDA